MPSWLSLAIQSSALEPGSATENPTTNSSRRIGDDDRPEIAVRLLEAALIIRQNPLEMMEKHPVEDGPLRISGTIDSRHGGKKAPRNEPTSRLRPCLPLKRLEEPQQAENDEFMNRRLADLPADDRLLETRRIMYSVEEIDRHYTWPSIGRKINFV
jgi:hypothetical protein